VTGEIPHVLEEDFHLSPKPFQMTPERCAPRRFHLYWSAACVRQLLPKIAADGAIYVSDLLDFDFVTKRAELGDYVWVREGQDPWDTVSSSPV
jgi:hypothetical protein